MNEHKASRTLVKSPPELWAECSDAASLTKHLDQFGEIKITRLEPETAVAWEGERVSGTVRLEPSGWGTRVTLTVTPEGEPAEVEEPVKEPSTPVVKAPAAPAAEEATAPAAAEPVVAEKPVARPPAPPRVSIAPVRRGGLFGRLLDLISPRPAAPPRPAARAPEHVAGEPVAKVEPRPSVTERSIPEPSAPQDSVPEPSVPDALSAELADLEAALGAALDSLGQAHHRPFSRA